MPSLMRPEVREYAVQCYVERGFSPTEVADVSKTFGAAYEPQPKREDGSYSVRHSTDICLVGPGGRIFKRFELTDDPKAIADAVRQYAARVPRKAPATASADASTKGGAE